MLDLACNGIAAEVIKPVTALSDSELDDLKRAVYQEGIVVLREQRASPSEFVDFGRRMGEIVPYYEEMYRHAEHEEIFVSSNCQQDGKLIGVPRTGKFWHSDYAFMSKPFAFTITYPQIVSSRNRGTYFIDMARAYRRLPDDVKSKLEGARCIHSVRRYFKIRPEDVYRPLGEVLNEVDQKTPPVMHSAVVDHPVTGDRILYLSRGFTQSIVLQDDALDPVHFLEELFDLTGQMDDTFSHPNIGLLDVTVGDIIVWDNRRFIHHAKHSAIVEPAKTYRLTAYDGLPFSVGQMKGTSVHEKEGRCYA